VQYEKDPTTNLLVRMIIALAFIPPANVADAFADLSDYIVEDLQPIMDYIEDNYIIRMRHWGNGQQNPRFEVGWWNVYERTLEGETQDKQLRRGWAPSLAERVRLRSSDGVGVHQNSLEVTETTRHFL